MYRDIRLFAVYLNPFCNNQLFVLFNNRLSQFYVFGLHSFIDHQPDFIILLELGFTVLT